MSPGYWGCAAGKAKSAAKTELEKIKMADMTCEELIKEAAKIIYQVLKDVMCTRYVCFTLLMPGARRGEGQDVRT